MKLRAFHASLFVTLNTWLVCSAALADPTYQGFDFNIRGTIVYNGSSLGAFTLAPDYVSFQNEYNIALQPSSIIGPNSLLNPLNPAGTAGPTQLFTVAMTLPSAIGSGLSPNTEGVFNPNLPEAYYLATGDASVTSTLTGTQSHFQGGLSFADPQGLGTDNLTISGAVNPGSNTFDTIATSFVIRIGITSALPLGIELVTGKETGLSLQSLQPIGHGFSIDEQGGQLMVPVALQDSSTPGSVVIANSGLTPNALFTPPYPAVIFTGNSTYTGGTTINAGAGLQLGYGGTTGAITGNVADSGALLFDRSDSIVFAGAVSGAGSLTQMGTGTVTLTGANTYTGGTTINPGGTLQIGAGGMAGSVTGNVADNGALVFNRADTVVFPGAVSGTGSLTQAGTGTLTLAGANTYTGGTTINPGATLQIGATGSITGNVTDNGALVFNQPSGASFPGAVSGSGSLTQAGSGLLTLTGANTYTGGTTIAASSALLVFGPTGSITGNVTDNGELWFDRPDNVVFPGAVTGSGALVQGGTGTLTLTGPNTYTGSTLISPGGTVQVGAGGTTGSITGNVFDAGALVFNRADNIVFAGIVSGTGSLTQAGTGTLTLSGANSYSGGTTIAAGSSLSLTPGGQLGAGPVTNAGNLVLSSPLRLTAPYAGSGTLTLNASSQAGGRLVTSGAASMANTQIVFNATNGFVPSGAYPLVVAASNGTSFAGDTITVNVPGQKLLSNLVVVDPPEKVQLELLVQADPTVYADTLMAQRTAFIAVSASVATRQQVLRGAPAAAGDTTSSAKGTTVWVTAQADHAHTSGGDGAPGYDSSGGGSVLGIDSAFAAGAHAGAALAVSDDTISSGNGTSYNGQTGQARLYGGITRGIAFLDAQIGGSVSDGTAKRAVFATPQARGSVDGSAAGASVRAGVRTALDAWSLEPSVMFGGISLRQGAVRESGAGASNLAIGPGSLASIYTLTGIEADRAFALPNGGSIVASGRVGWQHEMAATGAWLSASSGAAAVPFGSAPIARDAAVVSAGAEWRVTPAFGVFARYASIDAARANDQDVQIGLTYRW